MIRLSYQTGCLFPEKVEPAYIHLSETNSEDQIRYTDDVLPINGTVKLCFDHPLRHVKYIEHTFEEKEEVRLSSLVALFRAHYERMYKEEEEKCTHKEYTILRACTECNEDFYASDKLENFLDPPSQEDHCCICLEPNGDVIVRRCHHVFHRSCLQQWFDTVRTDEGHEGEKRNSCPMCRQPLIYCDSCHSKRKVEHRFFGAVPPYDANNEDHEDRPETDGPYGIHTIYYQDLYFKGFTYDRETRVIRLLPLERV